MDEFENCGTKEVWMKYGMEISQRFIPIHSLYHKLKKCNHLTAKVAHIDWL